MIRYKKQGYVELNVATSKVREGSTTMSSVRDLHMAQTGEIEVAKIPARA
ncbi:hypothetical protein ACT4MK_31990 [Bradyrhizobium barranii]|nr:hypothetical protein [Bradyrhizobium sp.]CUU15703.1 hypothetical protein CDS [Bradyrhizobium sp.]